MALNVLVSFAFHATTDLAQAKARVGQGLLMVDSGAFTAYTTGGTVSLADYAAYLRDWAGAWDTAVTLDVIGDHQATMRNTRRLHDMGLPVLPVFTYGAPAAELDAMARDFRFICAGGVVPLSRHRNLLLRYLAGVRRRTDAQGCKVHALGVGSCPTMTASRLFSGDSSAASGCPIHGGVLVWTGHKLRKVSGPEASRFAPALRRHGIDPAVHAAGKSYSDGRRVSSVAAGYLAVARADEHLKRRYPGPGPAGLPPGPHLYSAVMNNPQERASLELAQERFAASQPRPEQLISA